MPLSARLVLDDCEAAILELKSASQDTLRRRWLNTVTLLRAVGHVLDKVDGDSSDALRIAIDKQFADLKARKPEPVIFWRLIEEERNNVLKIYRFAVRGNLTIGVPPGTIGTITSPLGTIRVAESRFEVSLLADGPFAGHHPFTVVQDAINFWRAYLDDIER